MKSPRHLEHNATSHGFSLVEMMMVMVIVTLALVATLAQVDQVQQRAFAERNKLDQFESARNFLDQISIDARQTGYPNVHNFDISQPFQGVAWQNPLANDSRLAAGLVKLSATQLQFEGDVDGSGNVSIVSYDVNGDGACATCLERAQVLKVNGNSLTGQTNLVAGAYNAEVQHVQNVGAIFTAYTDGGVAVALPIDINASPAAVASVRVIQITLDLSDPTQIDPKTKMPLEATITGRVQVINCSMATTGQANSNGVQVTCQ